MNILKNFFKKNPLREVNRGLEICPQEHQEKTLSVCKQFSYCNGTNERDEYTAMMEGKYILFLHFHVPFSEFDPEEICWDGYGDFDFEEFLDAYTYPAHKVYLSKENEDYFEFLDRGTAEIILF